MEQSICYLDNAATTKMSRGALDKYIDIAQSCYGNPSSLHRMGFHAENELKNARFEIAKSLGAKSENIIFTGSATEASIIAMRGLIGSRKSGKILLTDCEHPAVYETARVLENDGFTLGFIPTKGGVLDLDYLEDALDEDTILVCAMMVNNESGAVFDVHKIRDLIDKNSHAKLHIDAVQGFGRMKFSAPFLRCDSLAVSAHKIEGPKGVGALYIADGVRLAPYLHGGGQEKGLRSGTESVAAIAAFGVAAREYAENLSERREHMLGIRRYAKELLLKIGAHINEVKNPAPHIINFAIEGALSEPMLHILEEDNVFISVGSACSSKKNIRSQALVALGVPNEIIDCSLRASFTHETTKSDIDRLIKSLMRGKSKFKI